MYDKEMQITKNFKLKEFTNSETAKKLGIDNHAQLTPKEFVNLTAIAENILQPIRDAMQIPIYISSGFRCPQLNRAVHGAARSQHCKGEAVDIYIKPTAKTNLLQSFAAARTTLWDVFDLIYRTCDFDQLIWETRPNGSKWIHVSYVTYRKNRKMVLQCKDGKSYQSLALLDPRDSK